MHTVTIIKTREKNNETTFVMNNWIVLLRSVCDSVYGYQIHQDNRYICYKRTWYYFASKEQAWFKSRKSVAFHEDNYAKSDPSEYEVINIENAELL